jgi:titin
VLDQPAWEQRFGFQVGSLRVGPLASAASFAWSETDKASYAQLLTDLLNAETSTYGRLTASGADPATSLPNIINCEKQSLSVFDQGRNPSAALQSAQTCLNTLAPGLPPATATPPPSGVPPTPTGLRVFATSPSDIQVMWDAPTGPVNGFRIYGGEQTVPAATFVTNVAANLTSQLISGRSAGVIYCYSVTAYNGFGESPRGTPVCASTSGVMSLPAAPVRLTVTAVSGNGLRLDWSDQATNEDGFQIMRNDTLVTTVGANIQTFTDFSWNPSGPNCYRVLAYNGAGTASSDQACPSGPGPTAPPSAPSNLQVATASPTSLTLTWGDTSGNEDGFYIYEGNNTVGTMGPGATAWTVNGWDSSIRHCFEVAAYNAFGQSARSNSVCAGPLAPPTATLVPTTLPAPR